MAFDWIESHRGLKDHPKTVMLTAAWNDRKPCVLGHLHELWWWTLEYAPDGIIRPSFAPQVIAACEWHGKTERFWGGLVESGFLELQTDGSYAVHDWDEYAVRRIQRHEQENKRKQEWRAGRAGKTGPDAPVPRDKPPVATSGATGPTRARHQPDLPDRDTAVSLSLPDLPTPTPSAPDVAADAQGPAGTASARDPVIIHASAGICPLCRQAYLGSYLEHTAGAHKVRPKADDLSAPGRIFGPIPDEVTQRLAAPPISEHAQ